MLQLMVAGNVRSSTVLAGPGFLKRRPLPHNNSFKPNPLRYSHNMAEKACHVLASTTQVGLIRTLCWYWDWWVGCSCCGDISVSDRVGSGVYCFG